MHRGTLSRRGFLQRSLTGLLAAGLPGWYAREILAAQQDKAAKAVGPNDKIVMGAIGIGSPQSRGRAIAGDARRDKNVLYVAACDVDTRHLENALQTLGPDTKGYKDFRELLDRKDINAVTIATPDHWHTLVAIDAMRKGKDVYCEKPLTLTIDEGKALVKVAKETNRIFQVGSQQRSDGRFRLACELVRNGRIGKLSRVETRIGANPKGGPFKVEEPPKELDWDMWLGPTPKVDYVKQRCHYEFRWWYDYSGGKMTDWGAHHNDIAQWGIGADGSGPIAVEAEGEAPSKEPNSYNCHPTFKVTYTYANGVTLVCTNNQLPDALDRKGADTKGHDNGVLFIGEKDQWIFVNRGTIHASDKKQLDEPIPSSATRLYTSANHMGNFLEGVRTRKACICTAEVGHRSVTVCHLGAIALRTGKKLKWDPTKEVFDDAEANKMLSRPYRAPWKLEA
ncbi:oxidoreductase [Planctomycetaceae bacterium SCGC AG-212-F19]|nr:oxidoreductase [Planctomycetaceae bacterium SCGC AG-212-F19]